MRTDIENAIQEICDYQLPILNEFNEKEFKEEAMLTDPRITFGNYTIQVMGEYAEDNTVEIYLILIRVVEEEKKGLWKSKIIHEYKEFDGEEKKFLFSCGLEPTMPEYIGKLLGVHEIGNLPLKEIENEILNIISCIEKLFPHHIDKLERIQSQFYQNYSSRINKMISEIDNINIKIS